MLGSGRGCAAVAERWRNAAPRTVELKMEKAMNSSQLVYVLMVVSEDHMRPRDTQGKPRVYGAEELDALADFGRGLPDGRGFVNGCLSAVRGRWRLAARPRCASGSLAAAEGR
jgi:hypothetical protein